MFPARSRSLALVSVALVVVAGSLGPTAQEPVPIKGEAALKHPAGQAALRAAELITAGKIDEAMALRTKESLSEWKKSPADERKAVGDNIRKMTPDPKVFADAVRKSGELNLMGNSAVMNAEIGTSKAVAYFEREGAVWKVSTGPMVFDAREPVNEVRIEHAEILKHAIATLALQYIDLIHGGKIEEAKRLATSSVQAEWKKEPASEKTASADYLKKTLPTRAALTALLQAPRGSSVLLIEDNKVATLNIIQSESKPTGPNTTSYSTTTTAIAFEMENGQWRLRQ